MTDPILYRRRIIPDECVELKDDLILAYNEEFILTSWHVLKPKIDLHHGYSCYFLQDGLKLSKMFRADGSLICWYADIVDYDWSEGNVLTSTDLLVDVIIEPDGTVQVVDLDELAIAMERGLISEEAVRRCLMAADKFLRVVYGGDFARLAGYIPS